jgi:hypothetical protein
MSDKVSTNRTATEHLDGGGTTSPRPSSRPSWRSRIAARVHTDRYDRMLAVGAPALAGSGLAVHSARLASTAEREAIARTLRRVVEETHRPPNVPAGLRFRIAAYRNNVEGTEEIIDAITLRLHSPRPIGVRGMARLRVLLSDGTGPMFRRGGGDLHGRLGAAFAAL